jgi:hypothetical protein
MKSFLDFIKEEVDLRGNRGIPRNLMGDIERQASRNLGVRPDDERQMHMEIMPQLMRALQTSNQAIFSGSIEQIEQRLRALEELAESVIRENFGDILDSSEKPIELDIKMVRPGGVIDEFPEMRDIPANANNNTRPPRRDQQNQDQDQDQNRNQDQDQGPSEVEVTEDDIKMGVEKKKILNTLTQGYGKSVKGIISYSELVEPGLREIFGNQWRQILDNWLHLTELADKLDWVFPLEVKTQMMKDAPQHQAGGCKVSWEKDEDNEDDDEQGSECSMNEDGTLEEGDSNDYDRITIKAVGVDFPMLIHETVKGIFRLLASGSIKEDKEIAKIIKKNTTSWGDEAQEFRYGVAMQKMYRDFILACNNSDAYNNMQERIFALLALDEGRGGKFTDDQFLLITRDMFSCFDLNQQGRNLEFELNSDKFNTSSAKRQIETLINEIVAAEREYERQLSRWEMEKQLGSSEEDTYTEPTNEPEPQRQETTSEDDGKYSDDDLSNMRQRDIQELIDDALDKGDYAEVGRLTKFLKEGAEIYLREVERINELNKYHTRRNK